MTTKNDEILSIEGWGIDPHASEVARFLSGPQRRVEELLRALRIFCEFIRGLRAFHFIGPCVTIFGSARFGEGHPYYQLAREMGAVLVKTGFTVMTGGGPGIMEAANRGAKEAGGRSIGCNIKLPREQAPNAYLDRFIVTDSPKEAAEAITEVAKRAFGLTYGSRMRRRWILGER